MPPKDSILFLLFFNMRRSIAITIAIAAATDPAAMAPVTKLLLEFAEPVPEDGSDEAPPPDCRDGNGGRGGG